MIGALERIRNQYEQYPFPVRIPEQERIRLIPSEIDRLGKIDHFCFGGRRDFREPMRILVAGGGTGDALIFLAEQLRETPCELVYLDLCRTSMEVARQRAEVRGLDSITWVHGSIHELSRLDLGVFDYINCVGVLHHLVDPSEGLAQLAGVLSDGGGIGLMLYGKYGRRSAYLLQEVMSLLTTGEEEELPARVDATRRALVDLTEHRVIAGSKKVVEHYIAPENDAHLVDTYLHGQDRPFTVSDIYRLLESCDLHLAGFTNFFDELGMVCPLDYEPALFFTDPALLQRVTQLPPARGGHLAEILGGSISMHAFYATRRAAAVPPATDVEMVPYFATTYGRDAVAAIVAQGLGQVELRLSSGRVRTLPLDPMKRAVLERIDGRRSTGVICRELLEAHPGSSTEEIAGHVIPLLVLLGQLGLLFSRAKELPPLPLQEVPRRWNGSIDLRAISAVASI